MRVAEHLDHGGGHVVVQDVLQAGAWAGDGVMGRRQPVRWRRAVGLRGRRVPGAVAVREGRPVAEVPAQSHGHVPRLHVHAAGGAGGEVAAGPFAELAVEAGERLLTGLLRNSQRNLVGVRKVVD